MSSRRRANSLLQHMGIDPDSIGSDKKVDLIMMFNLIGFYKEHLHESLHRYKLSPNENVQHDIDQLVRIDHLWEVTDFNDVQEPAFSLTYWDDEQ